MSFTFLVLMQPQMGSSGGAPASPSFLLLADGVSKLLLADGSSFLLLSS